MLPASLEQIGDGIQEVDILASHWQSLSRSLLTVGDLHRGNVVERVFYR
jgi:hypothetical protein